MAHVVVIILNVVVLAVAWYGHRRRVKSLREFNSELIRTGRTAAEKEHVERVASIRRVWQRITDDDDAVGLNDELATAEADYAENLRLMNELQDRAEDNRESANQ
ncbi:MAG: hypothetical protein HN742_09670 [Lentisphaerae bacterium]|nr:hypothetical protein [Lentisphaerota bacterium]MBT4816590.1 hypothetical protein [Lentisphaerota bacterium]MBT5611756.1 hypothetical protein [Lentisphaerota bacterium]MBT7062049.1 hypothetical protein [Lentisphaerota bacterium]MBT7842131.1 hypothetical protein [Lentisphaerota bacterium]